MPLSRNWTGRRNRKSDGRDRRGHFGDRLDTYIEGPGAAGPAGVQRDADPEGAAMTLRFIVAGRDRVPLGEEAPT